MRAQVLVYEGWDELDAIGPYEVLGHARLGAPELTLELVGAEGAGRVTATNGLVVEAAAGFGEPVDLLVVPGGGWMDGNERGTRYEYDRGVVPKAIAALHAAGATIASVCTGGMLLAAAGITDGRPATTHHGAHDDLAATGAQVISERVVDDGDLITAGGVTSGIDLALWIVEREFGRGLADAIASGMEYERNGGVHRGPRAQAAAA